MIPRFRKFGKGEFAVPLAVAALALVVFSNSLKNGFVWDDNDLIVDNPSTHGFSGVSRFFSDDFWSESTQPVARGYYRPLILLSYATDYYLWGPNPAGFHLTNILWHALASALVCVLVMKSAGSPAASLLAGALFAVHPVHVESVTFISGRTDVLATVFALISVILFIGERRAGKIITPRLPVSVLFFALALLSKEVAAVLPALLLVAEFVLIGDRGESVRVSNRASGEFVSGRGAPLEPAGETRPSSILPSKGRLIVAHGTYWLVLGVYLGIRFAALGIAPRLGGKLSARETLLTMPGVVVGYFRLLTAPVALCADYAVVVQRGATLANSAAIIATLAVCGGIGLLILRKKKSGFFAVWTLMGLLPVLQIMPISVLKAERFLYLPSVGFCALAGLWGASALEKTVENKYGVRGHGRTPLRTAVITAIIGIFSLYTFTRNTVWKDEFTLYRATASCAPGNVRVQYNIGNAYFRRGDLANALKHTEIAFRLRPNMPQISYNLGLMYAAVGRLADAEAMYRKAIESDPAYARAHNNLAALLYGRGCLEDARSEWSRTLSLDPGMEQAKEGLRLLDQTGR